MCRLILGDLGLYEGIARDIPTNVGSSSLVRGFALRVAPQNLRHGNGERGTLLGFSHMDRDIIQKVGR
jgi:hypothetical protein